MKSLDFSLVPIMFEAILIRNPNMNLFDILTALKTNPKIVTKSYYAKDYNLNQDTFPMFSRYSFRWSNRQFITFSTGKTFSITSFSSFQFAKSQNTTHNFISPKNIMKMYSELKDLI